MWPCCGREGPLWRLLLLLQTVPLGAYEASVYETVGTLEAGEEHAFEFVSLICFQKQDGSLKAAPSLWWFLHIWAWWGLQEGESGFLNVAQARNLRFLSFLLPIYHKSLMILSLKSKWTRLFLISASGLKWRRLAWAPGIAFLFYQPLNSSFHLLPVEFTLHRVKF